MYFKLYQVSVIVDVDRFLEDRTSLDIHLVLNLRALGMKWSTATKHKNIFWEFFKLWCQILESTRTEFI